MNTDAVAPTQKNPPQSAAADAPQSAGGVVSAKPRLPPVIYLPGRRDVPDGHHEFLMAGLLPGSAAGFGVSIAHAGLSITVFAAGMIIGAPAMTLATLRLPRRVTLTFALTVCAAGHVIVAVTSSFAVLLAARFLTALGMGRGTRPGRRSSKP
jgi:DHA1 family inner membrane transport protein